MSEIETKIPYIPAKAIADEVLNSIINYCEISNIAGSVRRKTAECGDIEIVAVPKITMREDTDLFGEIVHTEKEIHPEFRRIVTGLGRIKKGQITGRYMQIEVKRQIDGADWLVNIDLFMPQSFDYWRNFAIRTGSAEYARRYIANKWVAKGWRGTPDGLRLQKECFEANGKWFVQKEYQGKPTIVPHWKSEKEFFLWLGVQWLEPQYRNL